MAWTYGANMKVLVVNDNPAINTIIEEILNDDGHEIYGADKLDVAESILETYKPEVIIIEETVDGTDAMKFIDKIDPESNIKILMLTNGNHSRKGKTFRPPRSPRQGKVHRGIPEITFAPSEPTCFGSTMKINKFIFVAFTSLTFHVKHAQGDQAKMCLHIFPHRG